MNDILLETNNSESNNEECIKMMHLINILFKLYIFIHLISFLIINSNYKREFKKNDFCNARQQILRQDVNDVFLDFSHRWKWPICLIAFIHSGNHHSHLQYFLKYSLHIINLQKYSRQNH